MKIVVHDYAGHPFQAQLSRELARRRHEVLHLHCATLRTPRGAVARSGADPPSLTMAGVGLASEFPRYSLLRRPAAELRYGRRAIAAVERFRPDVVVSANTPLLSQL